MNKYVFPGADASTPLGWFIDSLENAGFEIKAVDTIGGKLCLPGYCVAVGDTDCSLQFTTALLSGDGIGIG
jgi:hypothetical protein